MTDKTMTRRALLHEARVLRARLHELERVAPIGSWAWDPVSSSVTWSDGMRQIYGHEPDEPLPSLEVLRDGVHEADRHRARAMTPSAQSGGDTEQALRVVRPDGEIRNVIMSRTPLFDETGRLQSIIGAVLDTTAHDDLMEQLRHAQKLEAIGLLVGGIAHDVNNLLTVILSSIELLSLRIEDPEFDNIITATESAADLTQRLLSFSRRVDLSRLPLNINNGILSAGSLLERAAGPKVKLRLELAPELWMTSFDESQLQQILMNLVVNARDAMPRGGALTIRTTNATRDALAPDKRMGVLLMVGDTGCGMDDVTRTRIFEPFFTTKPAGAGTGLGLAMVFRAMQQSGGAISVESKPGCGATFNLFFPRSLDGPKDKETSPRPL